MTDQTQPTTAAQIYGASANRKDMGAIPLSVNAQALFSHHGIDPRAMTVEQIQTREEFAAIAKRERWDHHEARNVADAIAKAERMDETVEAKSREASLAMLKGAYVTAGKTQEVIARTAATMREKAPDLVRLVNRPSLRAIHNDPRFVQTMTRRYGGPRR